MIPPLVDRRFSIGIFLIAVAALAWSTAGFFTRLIQTDAATMIFWRGVFGGGFIAVFVLWELRRNVIGTVRSLGFPGWFITVCLAFGMVALIPAFQSTTVANVAIVLAMLPLVTAAVAWIWLKERPSGGTLLAATIGLLGIVIMMTGSVAKPSGGELLAALATTLTAIAIVAVRRYSGVQLTLASCLASFVSAALVWPFAAPFAVEPSQLALLVLFGFIQMAMGLTLFVVGSRYLASSHAALVTLIETPLAIFWVWAAFGEAIGNATAIGGVVVLLAVVVHAAHSIIERGGAGKRTRTRTARIGLGHGKGTLV
jgi:drug/metabolite transporter (DMT)-like permease